MQKQSVMCDGEMFEYDAVIPAGELQPYVLKGLIAAASAQGTGLDRDLYILPGKDRGEWRIFGSDGIVRGLAPDEPVYVRFIDVESQRNKLAVMERDIREVVAKYSV